MLNESFTAPVECPNGYCSWDCSGSPASPGTASPSSWPWWTSASTPPVPPGVWKCFTSIPWKEKDWWWCIWCITTDFSRLHFCDGVCVESTTVHTPDVDVFLKEQHKLYLDLLHSGPVLRQIYQLSLTQFSKLPGDPTCQQRRRWPSSVGPALSGPLETTLVLIVS